MNNPVNHVLLFCFLIINVNIPLEAGENFRPVAKTSTGRSILVPNANQHLVSWNTEAECPLYFDGYQPAETHQSDILDIVVSSNDRYAMSSTKDNKVQVWDYETGKELMELAGNEAPVNVMALSEAGVIAALGSQDGKISVWDMEGNKKINIFQNQHGLGNRDNDAITGLSVSVDMKKGQWIAVGDNTGWVTLWDIRDGSVSEEFKAFNHKVKVLKTTAGGEFVAAGSTEGKVLIWHRLTKEKQLLTINNGQGGAIEKLDISPDSQYLLLGDHSGQVYVMEIDSGAIDYSLKLSGSPIILAAFNNSNEEATIVDADYQVWHLRLDTKQVTAVNDISWEGILPKSTIPLRGRNWTEPKTGTEFIWVPRSCFDMGCKYPEDEGCAADNTPYAHVCLDGYWMAKKLVSKDQWQQVMGYGLPQAEIELKMHDADVSALATGISWQGARGYVCKMNRLTGYDFSIPSEAEWEKACRTGDNQQITSQTIGSIGSENSRILKVNKLPLENMNGSVSEWILDYYYVHGYHFNRESNPINLNDDYYYYYNQEIARVKRGGGWDIGRHNDSCITRQFARPNTHSLLTGFRLTAH